MVSQDTNIVLVSTSRQMKEAFSIREQVFVQEQGVPLELEKDGHDEECLHFLIESDRKPIGTGRLRPLDTKKVKLERMAILQRKRGLGLGRMLLDEMLSHAADNGFVQVVLHSQSSAVGFYQRAGFQPEGEIFTEAGIPHLKMEKMLASD